MNATVSFPQLLELLGYSETDHFSFCEQPAGGVFTSRVMPVMSIYDVAVPADRNVWFGVNPLRDPAGWPLDPKTGRPRTGRGEVDQVDRLVALYADLDAKAGGLGDFDTAWTVVDTVSEMLTSRPVAVTRSGNGLQPYWPLEDPPTGLDAVALLRRFGRLVRRVAEAHGGNVDSVYDLARVLRVPGSRNWKADPKPVLTLPDTGHTLTLSEVEEALAAYGIEERPEDREQLGEIISETGTWTFSDRTCHYVASMVKSWDTDNPTERHPWLLSQATRLAAARRLGCITEPDYRAAAEQVSVLFRGFLATGQARPEGRGEIADAFEWGATRISAKTEAAARDELGHHEHGDAIMSLVPDPPAVPWTPTVIQGGQSATAPPSQPDQPAVDGSVALALQPSAPNTLRTSEDAHAHQLIAAYGELIRYCPERGAWLAWTGARWSWQPKGGGVVREYAKNVARLLPQGDTALTNHKRRCLSSAGISGCLKQAETDSRVHVEMDQLDADPHLLNTPAGIVDLRTGHIAAPDPASLCTRTTTMAAALAPDPIWEAFLADTFGEDLEIRAYVQRLVGLTLIGHVRDQLLAFLHGLGANGKSTLVEVLMHVLGLGEGGYATAAPAEMLMIRKHSEHPAELAQLAGARMVVCSELDDGQRFAEAKIKQLTGRDSINARFLYGQPFTFTPTHTIWLLGNHRPQARTGGMAFWRRVKLIEFPNVVPEHKRDPALGDKLNVAGGTVLAWAIAGAVDYLTHGIREPASVSAATAAYAEDQDTVGRFVEDRCHRADSTMVSVQMAKLRSEYESWCRELGEEPVSPKRLGQELRDRFKVEDTKSNGVKFYTRITLLDESHDDPGQAEQSDPELGLEGLL